MKQYFCLLLSTILMFSFTSLRSTFAEEPSIPRFTSEDILTETSVYRDWIKEIAQYVGQGLPRRYSITDATGRYLPPPGGDVEGDFFTAPTFPRMLKHGKALYKIIVLGGPVVLTILFCTGTANALTAFLPTAATLVSIKLGMVQSMQVPTLRRHYQSVVFRQLLSELPSRKFFIDPTERFPLPLLSNLAAFDVWAAIVEERLAQAGVYNLKSRGGRPHSIFESGSYFQRRFFLETLKIAKRHQFPDSFYSALLLRFLQLPEEVRTPMLPAFFKDANRWLEPIGKLQFELSQMKESEGLRDDLTAISAQVEKWSQIPLRRALSASGSGLVRFCSYFLTDFYNTRRASFAPGGP